MGTGPNQFYQIHYPNSNQDGERLSHPIDFIPTKMFDIPVVLIFRALARLPTTYLNTPIMLFKEQLKRELNVK